MRHDGIDMLGSDRSACCALIDTSKEPQAQVTRHALAPAGRRDEEHGQELVMAPLVLEPTLHFR